MNPSKNQNTTLLSWTVTALLIASYVFSDYKDRTLEIAVLAMAAVWAYDWIFQRPKRLQKLNILKGLLGYSQIESPVQETMVQSVLNKEPWVRAVTEGSLILAVVFVFKAFFFEPIYIPSESMLPSYKVGDVWLANKHAFGIKDPLTGLKLTQFQAPKRGQVVVFRYPNNPGEYFIKRLIGKPGDVVQVRFKNVFVNGKEFGLGATNDQVQSGRGVLKEFWEENADGVKYKIALDPTKPLQSLDITGLGVDQLQSVKEGCTASNYILTCKVPEHQYFFMGDNRDNSYDSRYWGFVPEQNLVATASEIKVLNLKSLFRH